MISRSNSLGQRVQLVAGGPVAALAEDFAQHAGRLQAGHARQIDGRLGVAGPAQHAAFLGHQRKEVPGPDEVGRLARRVDDRLDRARPAPAAVMPVRQRAMIDRHGEARAQRGRVVPRPSAADRAARPTSGRIGMQSCPRPCVIMKLTISGVDLLGGADEIALVLAVLGVHRR